MREELERRTSAFASLSPPTNACAPCFSAAAAPDAIVIIRGGGAVNDLAWLNDYELARFICLSDVPLLTGIGHERDSTVLDEVAHPCFDSTDPI